MEYDERLARFRQGLVNPFDRGEDETSTETKGPSKTGESQEYDQNGDGGS